MHDNSRCLNCERAVTDAEQKFCPSCGQPTPAHRLDWHFLGHELEHSVLHMDRGILYSLKQLMLRPGHFLRDYIEGRRANQAKPMLLIMVMAAVVVLLNRFVVGAEVMDMTHSTEAAKALSAGATVAPEIARFNAASAAITAWMNAHFAAFTLLLLPIEAGVTWLMFRRYSKLNYPEWLVMTALLTVQMFVIWTVLVLVQRWLPHTSLWVVLIAVIYAAFSMLQFFAGRPVWSTLWRTLLSYLVFSVLSLVLVTAAAFGVMLLQ